MATVPAFKQLPRHSHFFYEREHLQITSHGANKFRLLRILPDTPTEPIRCLLTACAMDHAPVYIALSYTWGPEYPQKAIQINGSEFFVRQNLFDFLMVARDKYSEYIFWIDQICIDQGYVRERNHQVSLMSRIYTEAVYVFAWLGAEGDDSDVAISYIEELHKSSAAFSSDFNDHESFPKTSTYIQLEHPREYDALIALFARPYWRRLWILQEVALAREVILLCGTRMLPWDKAWDFVLGEHWSRNSTIVNAHATKVFTIHRSCDYYGDQDVNGSYARSFMLDPMVGQNHPAQSFRALVYKCCDFECSDPRDKIYGLLGIAKRSHADTKRVDVDYNKPVERVFWDFFTTHLNGIHIVRRSKSFEPVTLPVEEVLDDWWHYAMRLMDHMELDSYSLRKDVASALEKAFGRAQRKWLANGSINISEMKDVPGFFAEKLQSAGTRMS